MIAFPRANVKVAEVSILYPNFLKSISHRRLGTEDMFGADDADWAIYRKIVGNKIFSLHF